MDADARDAAADHPEWLADVGARRVAAVAIGVGAAVLLLTFLGLFTLPDVVLARVGGSSDDAVTGEFASVEWSVPALRGFAPELGGHVTGGIAHLVRRSHGGWLSGAEFVLPVALTETVEGARVRVGGALVVDRDGLGEARLGRPAIEVDATGARALVPYELSTGWSSETGTAVVELRVVDGGDALVVLEDGRRLARHSRVRPVSAPR